MKTGTHLLFRLVLFFCFLLCYSRDLFADNDSHTQCSIEWHKRNGHLVPDAAETVAIMKLAQDYTKPWRSDNDADGDGASNDRDPSPYDWRENGYNPFGALEFLSWNHSWNNYKYDQQGLKKIVALLKEAGVTYVRLDFLWQDMEPEPQKYNFGKYDYLVDLLTQNQIRILGLVSYSASWAGKDWNYPPYKNETFVNYAAMVVSRYKDKVKYWEIWNEPDSLVYWAARDDLQGYTQLLKESYSAIKRADPSAKVLLGGLTNEGFFALKAIYKNGGKNYFDIVNIHPFTNPLLPGRIHKIKVLYKNLRREMIKNGDGHKKIWFTEIGCPGVKERNKGNGWWEGASPTEKEQAVWAREIYTELLSLEDVEKIFWAFFRDTKEHFKCGVDYFGLVRWDFSKKPGFYAYKKCVKKWEKAKRP